MKNVAEGLLAGLLGQVDGVHEPVDFARSGENAAFQAQWQLRWLWRESGLLPWQNAGEDGAARKRIARGIAGLAEQGLVRVAKRRAGLTAAGLTAARQLCGHPEPDALLCGVDYLLSLLGGPHEWSGGEGSPESGYVSEASMAGFSPWPRGEIGKQRCPGSEWTVAPLVMLAVAGLVESTFRRGFELPLWALTADGRGIAVGRRDSGKADPAAWGTLRRVRRRETPTYWAGWKAEIEAQKTRRPLWANRVSHPLGDVWPTGGIGRKSNVA